MNEEKPGAQSEWNEKSQELTLVKKGELPANLNEIDVSMILGDLTVQNCIDGETPSYVATAVVKAKTEKSARKEYADVDAVYGVNTTDSAFNLKEKPNNNGGSGSNVVVSGGGFVMINGVVMSGGGSSSESVRVDKKVVMRIRPDQAKNFDFSSSSGDIDLAKVDGKGIVRTASGDISVESVSGRSTFESSSGDINIRNAPEGLNIRTASGDLSVNSVVGRTVINTSSGEVRIGKLQGEIDVRTASGAVTISDANIDTDSSINTSSGRISVEVSNPSLKVGVETMSGKFKAPAEFVTDKDPGRSYGVSKRGHLGTLSPDTRELSLKTASGSIELIKK